MINSRGSIFLYAIMVSLFVAILGYMIMLKMDILVHNLEYQNYDVKLQANIKEKANLAIEYDSFLNSNSGGSAYDNDNFFYTNSTGTTDDDDDARKAIYGYIGKGTGWYNIFNVNKGSRKIIADNSFNSGSNSVPIGLTQTGYVYLDIDNPYSLKVLEFDKSLFESVNELRVITGSSVSFSSGQLGWIMPDLSLSGALSFTGSRKVFDFKNRDYAFFLSFSGNLAHTGVDFLRYNIMARNKNGSWVYITPLDDSSTGATRYFGSDIIIDREGDYRYKQFEVVRKK